MTEQDDDEAWHTQRLARLMAPEGWLSLIGLVWLDDGAHRVGSGADCDVQLPAGPALLGELSVKGNTVRWQPRDDAARVLATDANGEPDTVRNGRYSFIVIEREGRLAARLRDAEAPARIEFAGIPRFPFDPSWRKAARWQEGAAIFAHDGKEYRLAPQDAEAGTLHFVFGDRTSGRETYGGGRFLYAEPPREGRLMLDFNRAFNPPCVFTPFATCPVPTAANRLPLAITAGECVPK